MLEYLQEKATAKYLENTIEILSVYPARSPENISKS